MITNPTIEKKKPTRQTNKQNKRIVISYIFYFKCPLLKKKTPTWKNPQVVNNIQKLGEHTVG